jgi:hypothetical protein
MQLGNCEPLKPIEQTEVMFDVNTLQEQLSLPASCEHEVSGKLQLLNHHLTEQTLHLGPKQIVLTFLDMFCNPL